MKYEATSFFSLSSVWLTQIYSHLPLLMEINAIFLEMNWNLPQTECSVFPVSCGASLLRLWNKVKMAEGEVSQVTSETECLSEEGLVLASLSVWSSFLRDKRSVGTQNHSAPGLAGRQKYLVTAVFIYLFFKHCCGFSNFECSSSPIRICC